MITMKEMKHNTDAQAAQTATATLDPMHDLEQMRQEMTQLRSLLEGQQIVNARMMRRAMSTSIMKEKKNIGVSIVMALMVIALSAFMFPHLGLPLWFGIFTVVFMIAAIAASIYSLLKHMSIDMTQDNLLGVASKVTAYKQFTLDWLKFSIPTLVVWIAAFFYNISTLMPADAARGMLCGGAVGVVIGSVLGVMQVVKSRRRMNSILAQIEELREK